MPCVNKQSNPDDTWEISKKLLMQIIDKYAPHLGLELTIAIAAMFLQQPMLLVVGLEIVGTASTFQVKIGVSSYFQVILSRSSVRSFSTT